jgi:hypothetical protein
VGQYDRYLDNPDPAGSTQTVYEYRFETPRPPVPAAAKQSDSSGTSPFAVAAGVVAGVLTLVGLAAIWARL